jgi:photosystem II stability/assembly factor-like uncharacterized protein
VSGDASKRRIYTHLHSFYNSFTIDGKQLRSFAVDEIKTILAMKLFTKSFIILGLMLAIAPLFSATNDVEPVATNIILQSKDGGLTWEDISSGLPDNSQPEDFFAGESEAYMRVKNVMYRRKSNLKTPVWEKENGLDTAGALIDFNRSGAKTYNYENQIFPNTPPQEGAWLPVYTNFKEHSMRSVFETADGSIFLGYRYGLYKSIDNGQSWERVPRDGRVMGSKGVFVIQSIKKVGKYLLCGHPDGIFRSSDMGKTWNKVHSSVDKKEYVDSSNSFNDHKEVFTIYVSGNIVYAVARSSAGC